jgi:arylsulfatase
MRLIFVFLLCMAALPLRVSAAAATTRPNIVLILADDLGFSDLGCYGSEIATPNIDRLAATGVRFTQFYNNGRCCPSRASLMTGKYPHQVGIGAMIDPYAKWIRNAANSPAYAERLSPDSPTMPELLRQRGYQTLMCGKWHLGYGPKAWPASRGFDHSFALIGGAMNYFGSETNGPPAPMALDHEKFIPPPQGFFSTDAFTDRAIEFLDAAAKNDQPFFLYLAYNAVHWPLQARPEEIAKYRGKYRDGWQMVREARFKRMRELGVIDQRVALAPMDRGNVPPWDRLSDAQRDEWDLRFAVYAAMTEAMDRGVGRVMQALRDAKVEQNTLVLFLSDNGGAPEDPNRGAASQPTGSRDSFRGYARPWATVSNTPLRYHKVTNYEGGISAPLIVHWPGMIASERQGGFVREPAHLIDLLPTFLELAGSRADAKLQLEGQSIIEMLKGGQGSADRTFAWEHEGNRAIRKGDWKLARLAPDQKWELFDMTTDRAEQHDLAADRPEIVKELNGEYERWAKRCGVVPWEQIAAKKPRSTTSNH